MTIPNAITLFRLILVPGIIYALLGGATGTAFGMFLIAGVLDGVDGFVARYLGQQSEIGAYLDPLADKAMLVSMFVVLGYMGELPLWLVILAVSRDCLIIGGVLLAVVLANPMAVRPLYISKVNTVAQIAVALLVLFELAFELRLDPLRQVLIFASGTLTAASAGAYLLSWIQHMTIDEGNHDD